MTEKKEIWLSSIFLLLFVMAFKCDVKAYYDEETGDCSHYYPSFYELDEWLPGCYNFEKIDASYHLENVACEYCGNIKREKVAHFPPYDDIIGDAAYQYYEFINNDSHRVKYTCPCGEEVTVRQEAHFTYYDHVHEDTNVYSYSKYNQSQHKRWSVCYGERPDNPYGCGANYYILESHNWKTTFTKVDNTYCKAIYTCRDCGEVKESTAKHTLTNTKKVLKNATAKANGSMGYKCSNCKQYIPKSFAWTYNGTGCTKYDIYNHSTVFTDSHIITVYLKNPIKGSVIQVKVGNTIYTTTLKNTNVKQQVVIKNLKYGTKYSVQVYYKNKLIGKEISAKDEYIWIRQIKKGMTTKQVRWTWGQPEDIYVQSQNNVYWYYENGSMAKFYKGKLQSFVKR